jgi:CheY-like chemotaxis protein
MESPNRNLVVCVEDDPLIRMLMTDVLAGEGFEVAEAARADDALDILHERADETLALFTDIQMPGPIDGLELARHTGEHWPWIAVLVASGNARPQAADMPDGSRFLAKPYAPGSVMAYLRALPGRGTTRPPRAAARRR